MFDKPTGKLKIGSVDDVSVSVTAQYNPKELELGKHVPWSKHNVVLDVAGSRDDAKAMRGVMHLEYGGAEARTLALELVFDGFETKVSVEPVVEILEQLASPIDANDPDQDGRRPHRCVVSWGDGGMRPFRCVIESVTTKYTLFSSGGTPLRAVCTVRLMEADLTSTSKSERQQYAGVSSVK